MGVLLWVLLRVLMRVLVLMVMPIVMPISMMAPMAVIGTTGRSWAAEPEATPASIITLLYDHLADAVDQPESHNSESHDPALQVIRDHLALIITDPEAAVIAVILARRGGDMALALTLATMALDHGASSSRLVYELGFTLLLDGKCGQAKPIFQAFADGRIPAEDWIVEESRRALLLCPADNLWFYDITFDLGHDDNLAGAVSRQQVTPEKGSRLDQLLDQLRQSYPELTVPDEIALGPEPVAGWWTETALTLRHDLMHRASRGVVLLRAAQRLTTPRGYEATRFNAAWVNESDLGDGASRKGHKGKGHKGKGHKEKGHGGKLVRINQIDVTHHRREQGRGQAKSVTSGVQVFSALEWRRELALRGGVFAGRAFADHGEPVTRTPQGFRFRVLNSRASAHKQAFHKNAGAVPWVFRAPWWAELEWRHIMAEAAINRSRGGRLSFALGPIRGTLPRPLSMTGFYDQSRRGAPQPWLTDRHLRRHYHLGLTVHLTAGSTPVDLIMSYDNIASKDRLEEDKSLTVFFRFKQ